MNDPAKEYDDDYRANDAIFAKALLGKATG